MMNKIITTEVAADLLSTPDKPVSVRRVQQLAIELNLEPQRIGRMLIFSNADLKKMQGRKTSPGPKKREAA